jgi:hypothetical protein
VPGYSGRPLAAKLGLAAGQRVLLVDAPPGFPAAIDGVPDGVTFAAGAVGDAAPVTLLFATEAATLRAALPAVAAALPAGAMCWVAWPKRASRVPTDVTEDVVRDLALPLGLVDVKVCAMTDVWSGLKLVRRRVAR